MSYPGRQLFQRLFTIAYDPDPSYREFLSRAQTQDSPLAQVTVAVLDAAESERVFGVPLARRGIQPVFLRVVNRAQTQLRLHVVTIDRNYYTPLEAAGVNHYSILKRLSAFGVIGWFFVPLLALIPFKLVSAYRANRRMDVHFQQHAFRLRPLPAGHEAEGFVFTHLDFGTKVVRACFHAASGPFDLASLPAAAADPLTYRPPPGAGRRATGRRSHLHDCRARDSGRLPASEFRRHLSEPRTGRVRLADPRAAALGGTRGDDQ